MSKRFCLLLEDDWELMGDGSGNVASHQYLPTLFLLKIAGQLNIKVTFMVDVAQQLTFIEHQNEDSNVKIQKQLWDDTVRLMKENGFDVQLHLHPQWINATFKDGFFHIGRNRNLGTYNSSFQSKLLQESVEYLHALLRPIDSGYKVQAFKAGFWGLQPYKNLHKHFTELGIKLVLGVRKGLKIPSASVDYEGLEEDTLPYYPDANDINKLATDKAGVIVLPLAYYSPDLITLAGLTLHLLKRRFFAFSSDHSYLFPNPPLSSEKFNHHKWNEKIRLSARPYLTHLKIGDQPFSYLKASFDAVVRRLRRYEIERVPIVIESHTKLYVNNYADIARFLRYIVEKYEKEVEFIDLKTFIEEIERDLCPVRRCHES